MYIFFFLIYSGALFGADTVALKLLIQIACVDAITLSGSPRPLAITHIKAGDPYGYALDRSTTYAISTNNTGRSIYGALSQAMPLGTSLSVHLAPPTGATSLGNVILTPANNRIVSGISKAAEGSLAITYVFTADASFAPVHGTNIITYTVGP